MGKPRSVFNKNIETERALARQAGQIRQNATGMTSTFRGMPSNSPKISAGQTNKVGSDTEKMTTLYLESLRIDSNNRIDLATTGAGITSTVASGQYIDFKVSATSLLNIGPTNVTFKNTVLAPAIDFGSAASRLGTIYADALDLDNDLTVDGDVILGNSTASDTIKINGLFTSQLNINGQNMYMDVDRDSRIYSGSDDSIKIVTGGVGSPPGGTLQMEVNNGGVGISNDLLVTGNVQFDEDIILGSSSADKITFNADTENDITPNADNVDKLGATLRAYSYTWVKSGSGIVEGYATGFMPAPVANSGILFCVPTAGGKTELRVTFQTGVSQLIATEP
jgi:hypothetical protein